MLWCIMGEVPDMRRLQTRLVDVNEIVLAEVSLTYSSRTKLPMERPPQLMPPIRLPERPT